MDSCPSYPDKTHIDKLTRIKDAVSFETASFLFSINFKTYSELIN